MALRLSFTGIATAVLLLLPFAVQAQQGPKMYRVGVLWHAESREREGPIFEAFIAGLRDRRYVEGRNILLEHNNLLGRSASIHPLLPASHSDRPIASTG